MKQRELVLSRYLDKSFRIIDDCTRHIQSIISSNRQIVNKYEIRFIGLRRSGSHGIINWLLAHYGDPQHIAHYGDRQHIGIDSDIVFFNNVPVKTNFYKYFAKTYPKKLLADAQGDFRGRYLLSYNYENASLRDIVDPFFTINHDIYFGKSWKRYDILILRDPFNLMASIYQGFLRGKKIYQEVHFNRKTIIELWIDYAKEYLGETNYLKYNKILINYNRWFMSEDYRREIAHKLGLTFTDKAFRQVSAHGGGSSFEGTTFNQNSQFMKVIERWKTFIDDPEYQYMFNQEILDYSEKIFGFIDGTEELIKNIHNN